jgi:hypothetical protein
MKKEETQGAASKPISLAPLKFDDALSGLLNVKPPPKELRASRPPHKKRKTKTRTVKE